MIKKPTQPFHYLGSTLLVHKDHRGQELPAPVFLDPLGAGNNRIAWNYEVIELHLVLKVGDHGQERAMAEEHKLTTAQVVAEFPLSILVVQPHGTRTVEVQAALQMRVAFARHYLNGKPVEDPAVRSFLAAAGVLLCSMEARGLNLKDVGPANLAYETVELKEGPTAVPTFFDLGDWSWSKPGQKPNLLQQAAPQLGSELSAVFKSSQRQHERMLPSFLKYCPDRIIWLMAVGAIQQSPEGFKLPARAR